jgi:hypothetical protein
VKEGQKRLPGDRRPAKKVQAQGCPGDSEVRDHPGPWLPTTRHGGSGDSTHIVLGGVPPLLHVHHSGILHAVGEHLPHKASGALRRRHLLIPAGFLLQLPGSQRPPATPVRFTDRSPGSRGPQGRLRGGRQSRRARGLRAPRAAPVGLPRAPSLPRRRRRAPARPPGLSAAPWVRRELAEERRAGGVSRRQGHGAGAPNLLSVRGGAAGGAPSPSSGSGGSALAEAVRAGGGGRAPQAARKVKGGEDRGGEGRGIARGGAPGRGRGSGRPRGAAARPLRMAGPSLRAPTRAQSAASGLTLPWAGAPHTKTRWLRWEEALRKGTQPSPILAFCLRAFLSPPFCPPTTVIPTSCE